MNTTRRGRSALALVAASALVFAACGSDDDSGDSGDSGGDTTDAPDTTDDEMTDDTTDAGEGDGGATAEGIAYGNAQEFSNYNNNLGTSNSVKNSHRSQPGAAEPVQLRRPDRCASSSTTSSWTPSTVVSEDPQTIEYVVNADAVWSDGEPIDCDDFLLQYYANNGLYLQLDDAGEPVIDEETEAEVFLFDLVGTTGYESDRRRADVLRGRQDHHGHLRRTVRRLAVGCSAARSRPTSSRVKPASTTWSLRSRPTTSRPSRPSPRPTTRCTR